MLAALGFEFKLASIAVRGARVHSNGFIQVLAHKAKLPSRDTGRWNPPLGVNSDEDAMEMCRHKAKRNMVELKPIE